MLVYQRVYESSPAAIHHLFHGRDRSAETLDTWKSLGKHKLPLRQLVSLKYSWRDKTSSSFFQLYMYYNQPLFIIIHRFISMFLSELLHVP